MRPALRSQARRASAKVEKAIARGWKPGLGPVASFGTKRRARRQGGEQ
jgi:hypothetical protein